jgi:hypothetical protein
MKKLLILVLLSVLASAPTYGIEDENARFQKLFPDAKFKKI